MLDHITKCESKTEQEMTEQYEQKTKSPQKDVPAMAVDICDSQEPNVKIPPIVKAPASTDIRSVMNGESDKVNAALEAQELSEQNVPRGNLKGGGGGDGGSDMYGAEEYSDGSENGEAYDSHNEMSGESGMDEMDQAGFDEYQRHNGIHDNKPVMPGQMVKNV